MNYIAEYERWLNESTVDEGTKNELWELQSDEKEIRERFAKHLEFGTGGLRGIMGAGTNRINVYTIRRATQGLAAYIEKQGEELKQKGVVIAYDCRHNGAIYALETALVLVANGVKTYLFDELRPTPELSFAVRHLGTTAGIVITASHNPAQYNGYKVYWSDGGQLPPSVSDKVLDVINATDIFEIKTTDEESALKSGLLTMVGSEVDDAYIAAVKEQSINGGGDISIVYSPLHGAGNKPVRRVLKEAGFSNVTVVKEQELPDGAFPTVENPNPEYEEAFDIGVKYADEVGADLIFATDPDSDRVGACARNKNNKFARITGNQMGALLTEYILSQKQKNGVLPENAAVVSTIVSSRMTKEICKAYGVDYYDVYTGFKFIGEKIHMFEQTGCNTFMFGMEESYGYLAGTHARDKDAVVASMLIAEMAQWLGKTTLHEALESLYAKYGYHAEETLNIVKGGLDGIEKIKNIMNDFRTNPPKSLCGMKVIGLKDYGVLKHYDFVTGEESDITEMGETSNVLYFELEHDTQVAIRPSGTEPKIKFYLFAKGDNEQLVKYRLETIKKTLAKMLED